MTVNGGGGVVSVQPVHERPHDRDVFVPDRLGAVAGLRGHARDQFRTRLVLHDRRLSRLAGGAVAAPDGGGVLGRGTVCSTRRCAPWGRCGAPVLSLPLRARRTLPAAFHLCVGADSGRCCQVLLGRGPAVGFGTTGALRQRRDLWHRTTRLQSVRYGGRAGDRVCRLAGVEPYRRRADGSCRILRPRDARRARRQCRFDLHRHVRLQRVSRRALRRAGDADPEHRPRDGCADHRAGVYRRGDWRHGLVLGNLLGVGDLWPGIVVRHPDLSRLLIVFGLRANGGDTDRPPVGTVRPANMTDRRRTRLAGRIPWTVIVFLVAATVPWIGNRYDTFLASQIVIDALFAVSLNLLLGTTGLVSFGHVAYFGVGAYVCGILMKTYGVPFVLAFPAA